MTGEQAVWTEIAEAFDTPPKSQTPRQKWLTSSGICTAYERLGGDWDVLRGVVGLINSLLIGPRGHPASAQLRATLAGFLAAMTDAERASILEEAARAGGQFPWYRPR